MRVSQLHNSVELLILVHVAVVFCILEGAPTVFKESSFLRSDSNRFEVSVATFEHAVHGGFGHFTSDVADAEDGAERLGSHALPMRIKEPEVGNQALGRGSGERTVYKVGRTDLERKMN